MRKMARPRTRVCEVVERARREREGRGRGEAREEGRGEATREDSTTESDEPGKKSHDKFLFVNFSHKMSEQNWFQILCKYRKRRNGDKDNVENAFHATHSKSFPLSKSTLTAVESLKEKCGRPLQLQPGCFHMHNVPPFHNHLCVHPPPYLIFVISFTQAGFSNFKFYTQR